MSALYCCKLIREIESLGQVGLPPRTLMQRAGLVAANWAHELVPPYSQILVLVGPGNNGGDALEAAMRLRERGHNITVWVLGDPTQMPADAAAAYALAQGAGLKLVQAQDGLPADHAMLLEHADLVVDGLFGIGLSRAPQGIYAQVIGALRRHVGKKVLALDIPSGLNADTGWPLEHTSTVVATHTITFLAAKPGLYTGAGRDYTGIVRVEELGVTPAILTSIPPNAVLNQPARWQAELPQRHHANHKGSHGSTAILGGVHGMAGAALLAGRAALKLGSGRVFVGLIDAPMLSCDPVQPELMLRKAATLVQTNLQAVVAGPGMGLDQAGLLSEAFHHPAPLLLDADALNTLADDLDLRERLAQRQQNGLETVLTPHPLEAARLLDDEVRNIQSDRLRAALELARHYEAIVVLKGSGTVIANPLGILIVNPTGNAGLATAGTGDVLAGMIGALLAQGMSSLGAACAGVWLHGKGADDLVSQGVGPLGITASEVIDATRLSLNHLMQHE